MFSGITQHYSEPSTVAPAAQLTVGHVKGGGGATNKGNRTLISLICVVIPNSPADYTER